MSLMVHLIAGFPSLAGFTDAAKALRDGGAEILEIQIPFSDPSADGAAITLASQQALDNGFQVTDIFAYIQSAKQIGFKRIMLMTYANIPYRYGIEKFVRDMQAAGVEGLIVPDLPIEDTEGYYALARKYKISAVPVAVVGMPAYRLALLKKQKFPKIYVSLRSGITGSDTIISAETKKFLQNLSKAAEVYGGFGISNAEQIKALTPYVHAVVIGSYFTRVIQNAFDNGAPIYAAVREAVGKLS